MLFYAIQVTWHSLDGHVFVYILIIFILNHWNVNISTTTRVSIKTCLLQMMTFAKLRMFYSAILTKIFDVKHFKCKYVENGELAKKCLVMTYKRWYSPSNDSIASVVLHHLELHFWRSNIWKVNMAKRKMATTTSVLISAIEWLLYSYWLLNGFCIHIGYWMASVFILAIEWLLYSYWLLNGF